MKIKVDSQSLVKAISWVVKAVDAKDPEAFVALTLKESGEGELSASSTNTYMKSTIQFNPDEVEDEVKIALSGSFLARLVKPLEYSSGDTVLTLASGEKSKTLKVKASYGNFNVPVVEKRIPTPPEVVTLGSVNDREYFDYLLRCAKICDPDDSGTVLPLSSVDVKIDTEDEKLYIMATDRYTLAEVSLDFTASPELAESGVDTGAHYLIPHYAASLIPPSKEGSDDVTLVLEPETGRFGYRFDDGRESRLSTSDLSPIKYQALKNSDSHIHQLEADRAEILKAISILSSLAQDESDRTHWTITPDNFVVHDQSSENRVPVEAEIKIEEGEEKFSPVFLRVLIEESFLPITSKKVRVTWGTSVQNFVLRPLLDNDEIDENVFVTTIPWVLS